MANRAAFFQMFRFSKERSGKKEWSTVKQIVPAGRVKITLQKYLKEFMRILMKAVGGITGCRRFLPRTELCIRLTQLAAQTQELDDDDF